MVQWSVVVGVSAGESWDTYGRHGIGNGLGL